MEADLHTVIRAEVFREVQRRYVIWQLLNALKFVHSANISHRDIKPSNILIDKNCTIKLADFGLARLMQDIEKYVDPVLTDYVATRWYRAPEVLLGAPKYDQGIDIWGVGCIIAEVYISKPLFPGSSTLN
jgi:mitogen-activated protein kinase 15